MTGVYEHPFYGAQRRRKSRAMMRHRFGGFGGPDFGPGGPRRRMRRGDVRGAILLLLAEQPFNGYGLMQEIEARSDGVWRPSPGSVYPALAQLEDEGLVAAQESDGRKEFTLTDAGREYVEANREKLGEPWADVNKDVGEGPIAIRRLIGPLAAAAMQVAQVGSDAQVEQARELLVETRKRLYQLLAEDEA